MTMMTINISAVTIGVRMQAKAHTATFVVELLVSTITQRFHSVTKVPLTLCPLHRRDELHEQGPRLRPHLQRSSGQRRRVVRVPPWL